MLNAESKSSMQHSIARKTSCITLLVIILSLITACAENNSKREAAWQRLAEIRRKSTNATQAQGQDQASHNKALLSAATELLSLQEENSPKFTKIQLQDIQTRDGQRVTLLCYKNPQPSASKNKNADAHFWESDDYCHRLFDSTGRLLPLEGGQFAQHDKNWIHTISPSRFGDYDQITTMDGFHSAVPISFVYTVDSQGFIPQGYVREDGFQTPVISDLRKARLMNKPHFNSLLHSKQIGDLYRALWILDGFPKDKFFSAGFLAKHPNNEVRARAVAIIGATYGCSDHIKSCLKDSSPRVRLAALYALQNYECSQEAGLKLSVDQNPQIRSLALEHLCWEKDLNVARKALLSLIEARNFKAFGDYHGVQTYKRYTILSSIELADALVNSIEQELIKKNSTKTTSEDQTHWINEATAQLPWLKAPDLKAHSPRLCKLFTHSKIDSHSQAALGVALAKLDNQQADELLAPIFLQPESEKSENKLQYFDQFLTDLVGVNAGIYAYPLFRRENKLKSAIPHLQRRAQPITEDDNQLGLSMGRRISALVLLAKWNVEGSEELLFRLLESNNEEALREYSFLLSEELVHKSLMRKVQARGLKIPN